MQKLKQYFSVETLSAIFPWAVVSAIVMFLMLSSDDYSIASIAAMSALLFIYIVCLILAISDNKYRNDLVIRGVLIAVQYISVMCAAFITPFTFVAILITIWSAQLPYLMPFRKTLLLSPIWSSPFWLITYFYWQNNTSPLSALLFWTFNVFALAMVNANIKERRATEQALELNRELMATQTLLGEASKQAERVRIARNIHDLLGHHLTALTINLQVASRISEGEAQTKIQQCHDLTKLLLSDVREAVSEIREKSHIELSQALHALLDDVPNLRIEVDIESAVNISDVNVAEAILRSVQESITNTLRHSNAKHFYVELGQINNKIQLNMRDDGSQNNKIDMQEGNGLRGMRERILSIGGTIKAQLTVNGFHTQIEIPELI